MLLYTKLQFYQLFLCFQKPTNQGLILKRELFSSHCDMNFKKSTFQDWLFECSYKFKTIGDHGQLKHFCE